MLGRTLELLKMHKIILKTGPEPRLGRGDEAAATTVKPEQVLVDGAVGGTCQLFSHFNISKMYCIIN